MAQHNNAQSVSCEDFHSQDIANTERLGEDSGGDDVANGFAGTGILGRNTRIISFRQLVGSFLSRVRAIASLTEKACSG